MNNKYRFRFLLLIIGFIAICAISAFAKTATSIMDAYQNKGDGENISSKVVLPSTPSVTEQTRYAGVIPAVELESRLAEAEKAIGFLIEEHNRRVDMITMQEEYIENLKTKKVKEKFEELLKQADDCNREEISRIFTRTQYEYTFDSKNHIKNRKFKCNSDNLAFVPLNGLKDVDILKMQNLTHRTCKSSARHSYPFLSGGAIWDSGLKPYILGTYTTYLNEAKSKTTYEDEKTGLTLNVWKGAPFDPVSLDCTDWNNKDKTPQDSGKYAICKAASAKGLLSVLDMKLSKFNNLNGLQDLINNHYTTGSIPATFADCIKSDGSVDDIYNGCKENYDYIFNNISINNTDEPLELQSINGFVNYWEASNKKLREYRKARWLVGYQFLMDLYHNEKFGPLPNRNEKVWEDQKQRYRNEILQNYYADIRDHYRTCIGCDKVLDELDWNAGNFENEYFDYTSQLGRKVSGETSGETEELSNEYHSRLDSYYLHNQALTDIAKLEGVNRIYCSCCKSMTCGEDGIGCCRTTILIYDRVPSGYHSNDAPRPAIPPICTESPCPDEVAPGWIYNLHPQTVPHPLINNHGKPSVSESVYIDADTDGSGGYMTQYDIDEMSGKTPLLANGNTSGSKVAIPPVWANTPMISFSSAGVYGPSTYPRNRTWTPIHGTYYQPSYGPNKFEVKSLKNELPQISNINNLPMNQNRIQVYLDIYEAYVHAVDAATHAENNNKVLNASLLNMLKELKTRYNKEFYSLKVDPDKSAYQNDVSSMLFTGPISIENATTMDHLYDESIIRANFFYKAAKLIAEDLIEKIIYSEVIMHDQSKTWKEAYEDWKNKVVTPVVTQDRGDTSESPTIAGSGNTPQQQEFLTRLGRVYHTLFYFGGDSENRYFGFNDKSDKDYNISDQLKYKPDLSVMEEAIAGKYDAEHVGDSRSKIERLRLDNSFVTPKKLETTPTGETSRKNAESAKASNPGITFTASKEEHQHIGLWSDIPESMKNITLFTIKEGNVNEVIKEIEKDRQERLDHFSHLTENRGEWADRMGIELTRGEDIDSFFTKWNFDNNTCLLKRRDATTGKF